LVAPFWEARVALALALLLEGELEQPLAILHAQAVAAMAALKANLRNLTLGIQLIVS